jgi:microcystin-dependent protein
LSIGTWLPLEGQALDRVTYAELFALIGTTYGAGDGVTTFNIPDMRSKYVRGYPT